MSANAIYSRRFLLLRFVGESKVTNPAIEHQILWQFFEDFILRWQPELTLKESSLYMHIRNYNTRSNYIPQCLRTNTHSYRYVSYLLYKWPMLPTKARRGRQTKTSIFPSFELSIEDERSFRMQIRM
jgi:hypothetical protein